jgi:hypothetical protein
MTQTPNKPEWASDWKEDERQKLLAFKALSATEKIRAVEHLNETAAYFLKRSEDRRKRQALHHPPGP